MKNLIFSFVGMLLTCAVFAQDLTQTVRGTLIDQDTQTPLIGATVVIIGSDPVKGAVTDMEGNFRIEGVAIGRTNLKISYMGYEDRMIPNLLVTSAKEVVLEASLEESFEQMEEITVSAKADKAEVLNEMSLVSARSFSVDETKRYAGSFADPARMVSSYAGVTNQAEGNNDIVVRGNSPRGILWRLEGVEIPNPNHFANEGATGGPINALNSNMLSDSDFMSGAFAPEYGNALSGVFDMKLKKGNNERREYTAGISTLGLDFTLEGPLRGVSNGSYLANYRYSSLSLIDAAGIVDFGGVPKYQDASFNVYLPAGKSHYFSIFGLGGLSKIAGEDSTDDTEEVYARSDFHADMGVIGVVHNYLINDRSFLRTTVSASGTRLEGFYDELNEEGAFFNMYNSDFKKSFLKAATSFNHKFNSRHKVETGLIYTHMGYNMVSNNWDFDTDQLEVELQDEGNSYYAQAYASWKYRMTEELTMTSGLHYMHLGLNNSYSIEPRVALKYALNNRSSLSAGMGLHSKMESVSIYLGKQQQPDGTLLTPNKNLGLSKAAHYVVGYDWSFGENVHMKVEAYYQHLFNVPIEDEPGSTFSLLNVSDYFVTETLVNQGTGTNYGLEFTLEKYLTRGLYYMTSASVYQSKYTAMDGVERNTAFAGNYVFNVLGGKEWKTGKAHKNKVLFMNTKVSLIGGKNYTPIDLEASQEAGYEIRYDDRPFSKEADDVFIMNFSIGTRRNKGNTTREFKIDIQNVTNHQAIVDEYYLDATGEIEQSPQLAILPTISYTISF